MNTGLQPIAETTTPSNGSRKVVLAILLLILAGIGFTFLPVGAWLEAVRVYVAALGWFGPVAFVLAYIVCTVCLIPASAFTVFAGTLFGLGGGIAVAVAASNIGANLSFFLSRTILRSRVEAWSKKNAKVSAVTEAVSGGGAKIVMLLRLSPVFPFTILNYLLGITRLSWPKFALGSLIGMLPGTVAFVYIGYLTGSLANVHGHHGDDPGKYLRTMLQSAGLLATVAVTVILTRLARQKLKEGRGADHDR